MTAVHDIHMTPALEGKTCPVASMPHGNFAVVEVESSWAAFTQVVVCGGTDAAVVRSASVRAVTEYGEALDRLAE